MYVTAEIHQIIEDEVWRADILGQLPARVVSSRGISAHIAVSTPEGYSKSTASWYTLLNSDSGRAMTLGGTILELVRVFARLVLVSIHNSLLGSLIRGNLPYEYRNNVGVTKIVDQVALEAALSSPKTPVIISNALSTRAASGSTQRNRRIFKGLCFYIATRGLGRKALTLPPSATRWALGGTLMPGPRRSPKQDSGRT
jgi:hypothetical protein